MRPSSTALLVIGCSVAACSGHYKVGVTGVDGPDSTLSGENGGSSMVSAAGSSSGGSTSAAIGGDPVGECDLPAGDPSPLAPPFAAPELVWQRLSLWLNGQVADPPGSLPVETTFDWAGDVAVEAFQQSRQGESAAPAALSYLATAFDLAPDGAATIDWARRLAASSEPLQLLYAQAWQGNRTGIFGEPQWLIRHPRAVSRGVNIYHAVFGQIVPPPPPGVLATLPSDPQSLSGRERLERHSTEAACRSCHVVIDPLGLSLEHFDEEGNYRELDAGKPVDSSGTYQAPSSEQFSFRSMQDLGPQLAESCGARVAFADVSLTRALLDAGLLLEGESITLAHSEDLSRVRRVFVHGRDYETLIRAIAQTAAFLR